jgi:hypothetical protein
MNETTTGGHTPSQPNEPAAVTPERRLQDNGQAGGDFGEIKDRLKDDFGEMKRTAGEQLDAALDRAETASAEGKTYIAKSVSGIAAAIEKVGRELEQGAQPEIGRYAIGVGQGIERFARDIRDRDLGEIARIAEEFGRKRPVAFLGAAALAGFATSRFLRASAERQRQSQEINPGGVRH